MLKEIDFLEEDKATCLHILQNMETPEMWDVFLKKQVKMFFNKEIEFFSQTGDWLAYSENVLEMGCGNGFYLKTLSEKFKEKSYVGIDKDPSMLANATSVDNVTFEEGTAEIEYPKFIGQFDVIIFRLALLHLTDPHLALKNAYSYLKPSGHIMIVDAFDAARESSHRVEALEQIFEAARQGMIPDRTVSFKILKEIECKKGILSDLFKVVASNLNIDGKLIYKMKCEGDFNRKFGFAHLLLFAHLMHRRKLPSIDLNRCYDELKVLAYDPSSWFIPGLHFMVLKKITRP